MSEVKSEAGVSSVFFTLTKATAFPHENFCLAHPATLGVAAPGRESGIRLDTQMIVGSNRKAGIFFLYLFRLWQFHANQPELEIICRHPLDVRPTTV
jgi:hypothetical protein